MDYELVPASEGITGGGLDSGGATSSIFGAAGAGDAGVSGAENGGADVTVGPLGRSGGDAGAGGSSSTTGSDDTTCDGIDDDGDGEVDDDYVASTSACGMGACQSTGTLRCVSGSEVDDCMPGAPLDSDDATCDGTDDDCDGQIDDDYVASASSCGAGECQSAGTLQCISGNEVDDCVPGSPASTEDGPLANGLDDDCDGIVDEESVPCDTTPRPAFSGQLRVAGRDAGIRVYAPASALPLRAKGDLTSLDALIDIAVRKYAPLPAASLAPLVGRLRYGAPQWSADLKVAVGRAKQRLASAHVAGTDWFWPKEESLPEPGRAVDPGDECVRLLAPFDPVVWGPPALRTVLGLAVPLRSLHAEAQAQARPLRTAAAVARRGHRLG